MTADSSARAPNRDLAHLFSPRAIAVVGASEDPNRIGGQPMVFLTEFGYAGKVHPVHPRHREIRGIACCPDVRAVPKPCDVALVAVAAAHVPGVIDQCGEAGIPFAVVVSSGFRETGEAGRALERELRAALDRTGVRMIGPNCQGILNNREHVHCGFGSGITYPNLKTGPVAMIAQSGGYGFTLMARVADAGIGYDYVATVGNSTDLDVLELMEWFLERSDIDVVMAFVEGVADGRRLRRIGERSLELGKPILIQKGGISAIGSRAAASHTANLTGDYTLYRTAFRAGGFIEYVDADDLVDKTRALLGRTLPGGNRLVVLSASGGSGAVIADRCETLGLELPVLPEATQAKLRPVLSEFSTLTNPVDMAGSRGNTSNPALRIALADPAVDLAVMRSRLSTLDADAALELVHVGREAGKPVLVALGADRDPEATAVFDEHRVSWHLTVGRAAVGAAALCEFAAKRRRYLAGRGAPARPFPRPEVELPAGGTSLSEHDSKALLAAYGVPCATEVRLPLAAIEALDASPIPFPLAVKVDSPDLPHKTEAGAVRLGAADLAGLKAAAREVVAAALVYRPGARISGVLIAGMATGTEVIVGAVNDPSFGPVIAFGLGGIFAELLQDVTHRYAPFDHATAHAMIREIRAAPLVTGYRGRAALDVDALADALVRISWLAADHEARIAEIDVNPLFVRAAGQGVVAADGLVVLRG